MYTVYSPASLFKTHRTKSSALKDYFRRYHRGENHLLLTDATGAVLKKYTAKVASPAKRKNPQHTYRTEASFRKALQKAKDAGTLVHWYGTDHGWVIVTKKIVKSGKNPKASQILPALIKKTKSGAYRVYVDARKALGIKKNPAKGDSVYATVGHLGDWFKSVPAAKKWIAGLRTRGLTLGREISIYHYVASTGITTRVYHKGPN